MWVGGAAWAAHFFYDYYLYTGDREFLAKHALPFMQETALFFEDYLYEGPDGRYIFNPTTSPENSPKNTRAQGTFNATMDIAAAKELLNNVIAGVVMPFCERIFTAPIFISTQERSSVLVFFISNSLSSDSCIDSIV